MSVSERVREVVEPVVAAQGVDLFDLEQAGPVLRVAIDRAGGVDIDAIAAVTRAVSRALDEDDPITGQYTLEVSSPGLERPLRTPAHFAWAVGREVSVKTVPDHPAGRRLTGTVAASDADGITLVLGEPPGEEVRLTYHEVEKARTVFEWGPAPKPGKGPKSPKGSGRAPNRKGAQGRSPAADSTTIAPTTGTGDQAS